MDTYNIVVYHDVLHNALLLEADPSWKKGVSPLLLYTPVGAELAVKYVCVEICG